MKSMLLADALVCVAAGLPWLEPLPGQQSRPCRTTQVAGLWIDFDNGQRRTHERFGALARARKLNPSETSLHYVSMPAPWLNVSDSLEIDTLAERISRLQARMVVIDNLGTVSGGVDENSPAMISVMSNLRRLAEKTGAAIVVIHHQRKSNGIKGRAGDTLRGHSCIEAALDLALLIERDESSSSVTIKSTKTRDIDTVTMAASFSYEHKPGTSELAEACFYGVKTQADEDKKLLQANILTCARANPGASQAKLIEAVKVRVVGISNNKIRSEILAMVESGQLRVVKGANGQADAYYPNETYVEFS